MVVSSRYRKCIVDIVDHEYSSEQISCKLIKLTVTFYKLIGKAYRSLLTCKSIINLYITSAYCRERKERGASELILLKKCDKPFCSLFVISDNILNCTAERRLNSRLILFLCLNDISNNTDYTFVFLFLFHHLSDAAAITVIALSDVFKGLEP